VSSKEKQHGKHIAGQPHKEMITGKEKIKLKEAITASFNGLFS